MYSDEGWGVPTWRGTLMGAPNSIVVPDPEDIRFDTYHFDTVWSPGHYLIPGAISLLGIPWGIAITLTVTLCLLACLLGWLLVLKQFAPGLVALPVMLLIGTFRFSTLPFGIYNGGEILLQGGYSVDCFGSLPHSTAQCSRRRCYSCRYRPVGLLCKTERTYCRRLGLVSGWHGLPRPFAQAETGNDRRRGWCPVCRWAHTRILPVSGLERL
jgi:hypothetical protein